MQAPGVTLACRAMRAAASSASDGHRRYSTTVGRVRPGGRELRVGQEHALVEFLVQRLVDVVLVFAFGDEEVEAALSTYRSAV